MSNMPPRLSALFVSLSLVSAPSVAAEDAAPADLLKALQACAKIEADAARLQCYDAALKPKPASTAETRSTTATASAALSAREAALAKELEATQARLKAAEEEARARAAEAETLKRAEQQARTRAEEAQKARVAAERAAEEERAEQERRAADNLGKRPERVEGEVLSVIRKIKGNKGSGWHIYLENGQVWLVKKGQNFMGVKVGKAAKIAPAMLGSFNMTVEGKKRLLKVKRVK